MPRKIKFQVPSVRWVLSVRLSSQYLRGPKAKNAPNANGKVCYAGSQPRSFNQSDGRIQFVWNARRLMLNTKGARGEAPVCGTQNTSTVFAVVSFPPALTIALAVTPVQWLFQTLNTCFSPQVPANIEAEMAHFTCHVVRLRTLFIRPFWLLGLKLVIPSPKTWMVINRKELAGWTAQYITGKDTVRPGLISNLRFNEKT